MKQLDREEVIDTVVNGWKRLRQAEPKAGPTLKEQERQWINSKKMLPVLLVLLAPGLLLAQQCKQPSDCTSSHAPHCSRWAAVSYVERIPKPNYNLSFVQIIWRWGWCQWTADYGDEGPREDLPTSGYCNSNKDCVPRAPFCSRCVGEHFPKVRHASVNSEQFVLPIQ